MVVIMEIIYQLISQKEQVQQIVLQLRHHQIPSNRNHHDQAAVVVEA